MIHFRRRAGKDLAAQQKRGNAARSKVRSQVEQVFARQKHICGLFIRTIGITTSLRVQHDERARFKIGIANIADNMHRLLWIKAQKGPA